MGVMQVVEQQRELARELMRQWAAAKKVLDTFSDAEVAELKDKIKASYGARGVDYDRVGGLTEGIISNPTAATAQKIESLRAELERAINARLETDTQRMIIYNATETLLKSIPLDAADFLRNAYAIPADKQTSLNVKQLATMYDCTTRTIYRREKDCIDLLRMAVGFNRVALLLGENV